MTTTSPHEVATAALARALWSTIGGNVATNAGGLCCLKYGVTRDHVLGLQAVVGGPAGAYGTSVRMGRRTTKGVAGYDLTGLFVGSEGTLGVVTEVTLRLRPAPAQAPRVVVGAFPTLVAAGEAVALATRRRLTPLALELLDRTCLTAVEEWKHLGLEPDAAAMLLAKIDTPGAGAGRPAAHRGLLRPGVGGAGHAGRHRGHRCPPRHRRRHDRARRRRQ